jgi:hypothetical protein
MSANGNKKKDIQLGMSHGSAVHRLRKNLLFDFTKRLELDTCYRCGEKILSVDDFTIEHKTEWLDSLNPKELFFDMDNIAFSHVAYNYGYARHKTVRLNATGFRGVTLRNKDKNRTKPYRAQIVFKHETIVIGHFDTPEEAAEAYDTKVIELLGDRGITNKELGLL